MNIKHMLIAATALSLAACDSALVTDPTASIDSETAISNARGVELALNGAYRSLQGEDRERLAMPDMYADNLDFTGTFQSDREFSLRNVTTANGEVLDLWTVSYQGINRANNVLDGIPRAEDLSAALASQYKGEALFIRAVHYFTLVRWFGGVPLVLEPSKGVGEESLVARSTEAEVYAQIIKDLEEASTLLPSGKRQGLATKGAADALLARAYLDTGDYAKARDKAQSLIGNSAYSLAGSFATVFTTKHSSESIFEVQYTTLNRNSIAFWFFPQEVSGRWGFSPTAELYNLYGAGDTRRDVSIRITANKRYVYKYPRISTGDDNLILLRLAEMYLIRAEANARTGAADATVLADINILRTRAGATPVTASGQAALLDAILAERRLELAFEGHRFFDLRRHGKAISKLQIDASKLLLPIPQAERDVNKNLTQNPGY